MEDTEDEVNQEGLSEKDLSAEEVLSHLEFSLWTAVVLIPVLYWANGPAVSHDQFVVRTILAFVAYAAVPIFQWHRWRRRSSRGYEKTDRGC